MYPNAVTQRDSIITMTVAQSRLNDVAGQRLIPDLLANHDYVIVNNPDTPVNTHNTWTFKPLYAILLREKYVVCNYKKRELYENF